MTISVYGLYRINAAYRNVDMYSPVGRLLRTWGAAKAGAAAGQFRFIVDSEFLGLGAARDGTLYIADLGNQRVRKLAATGQTLAVWG